MGDGHPVLLQTLRETVWHVPQHCPPEGVRMPLLSLSCSQVVGFPAGPASWAQGCSLPPFHWLPGTRRCSGKRRGSCLQRAFGLARILTTLPGGQHSPFPGPLGGSALSFIR